MSILAQDWVRTVVLALGLTIWVVTAFRYPSFSYVAALAGGVVVLAFVVVCNLTLLGHEGDAFLFLVLLYAKTFGWGVLVFPLAVAVFAGALALFCVLTDVLTAKRESIGLYLRAFFENASLLRRIKDWRAVAKFAVRVSLFLLGMRVTLFIGAPILIDVIVATMPPGAIEWLLALPAGTRSTLQTLVPFLFIYSSCLLVMNRLNQGKRAARVSRSLYVAVLVTGVGFLLFAIVILGISFVVDSLQGTAFAEYMTSIGTWGFRLLILLAALAVSGIAIIIAGRLLRGVAQNIAVRAAPVRKFGQWTDRVTAADSHEQAVLLRSASAEQLGVDPARFLVLLEEVEKHVIQEPALSSYWRKRYEAEELAKHDREQTFGRN